MSRRSFLMHICLRYLVDSKYPCTQLKTPSGAARFCRREPVPRCGLHDAAIKRRSRCGSLRGWPVASVHFPPGFAPGGTMRSQCLSAYQSLSPHTCHAAGPTNPITSGGTFRIRDVSSYEIRRNPAPRECLPILIAKPRRGVNRMVISATLRGT
jgi:hypothetical protein